MWKSAVRAIAIAGALAGAGCAGAPGAPPLPPLTASGSGYQLGPGDKIRVIVTGLDPMNNDYVIGDSGQVSLPYVHSIQATGRTLIQVQHEIEARLAQGQILRNPVVNVESVTLRPFYILGEVRNPGEYSYRPGTTVTSAAAMAGGFTYRAEMSKVTITRMMNGRTITGTARQDALVMPGDRIVVAERWF
jgi:polysaccharide biosynthesis/export protein